MSRTFLVHHLNHLVLLCLTLSAHLFANQVNNLLSHYCVVEVETSQARDKLTAGSDLFEGERCVVNLLSVVRE